MGFMKERKELEPLISAWISIKKLPLPPEVAEFKAFFPQQQNVCETKG